MDASMDLGDMVGKLEDEIAKLKRKNEILDRDCKDYLSKLETAGKWGQRLLEESADLKKKLKETNSVDIQELREEFKDSLRQLEAEINKLERENEALKAGGGAVGKAAPKMQRGMSDALAQNDEMMARIDELEKENRQLKRKLDQARDQIQKLDSDEGGRGGVPAASTTKSGEGFNAKSVFQSAFGYIQRDRLHKRLEEEGQRADELEMQLTNLQEAQKKAADTEAKLKQEFAEIQKFAQQQRALKYGAQAQLQDIGMKNDNMQGEMLRMQQKLRKMEDAPNTAMGHNEKIQVLKGAAPALNSLYADLKAGVDDIAWLTTEDDSDDSGGGSGSDSSSEPGDPSMYSKYLSAVGKDAPDSAVEMPKAITEESVEGEVGRASCASGGKSAYKGKEKSAYGGGKIPSAYDTMSKRERKVVKMTINETHKKLMGAFRLIEVLQQHVAKLTEELEYLEGAASMAKKINFYMGLGFVILSSGVIVLFAVMISTCEK